MQHFVVWRDPDHFFGAGKPFGRQLLTYDLQTLAAMDFLQTDAHPGDVVLTADNLLAPVLALTKCRVPIGYFAYSCGRTKRLHAQGDCGKEVLEQTGDWERFRRTFCARRSSLHRREQDI